MERGGGKKTRSRRLSQIISLAAGENREQRDSGGEKKIIMGDVRRFSLPREGTEYATELALTFNRRCREYFSARSILATPAIREMENK